MIAAPRLRLAVLAIALLSLVADKALAVQSFISVPTIAGEDSNPGYLGVMTVSSLTIQPMTLTVTKEVDTASPALFLATALGNNVGTVDVLLYNNAPAATPDAILSFFNPLVSSYQANGATEDVSFFAENPLELYLQVPGIPGVSGTPGYANVMRIDSFTLTANEFTIIKLQDDASDDLFLATANGVHFADARLLLYDQSPPGSEPDAIVDFQDLLITSMQTAPAPWQRSEQLTFSFDTLSQPTVPEPSTFTAALIGLSIVGASRRR